MGRWARFMVRLPSALIVWLGTGLGRLLYHADLRHRRIVRRNLAFAYPQWPRARVRQVTRRVFENLGITLMEALQLAGITRSELLQRVRIETDDASLKAIQSGHGVILISAHMGNWELLPLYAACAMPLAPGLVARPLHPPVIDRWVKRFRTRFGSIIIDKKGALPLMTQMLREGRALGLLIDQGTKRSESVEVTFLGGTVTATPAVALLARRCKAPVIPAYSLRERNGGWKIILKAPLILKKSADIRSDLFANTQLMTQAVEDMVRSRPTQWFWFHKRWKRHYPQLYPEDLAKRQRRKMRRRQKETQPHACQGLPT